MRSTVSRALLLPLLLATAACSAIQPRLDRDGDRPPFDPDPALGGPPWPPQIGAVDSEDTRPVIDRVCRTGAMPFGYIAVDYATGGRNCPQLRDEDNSFRVAIIARYSDKAVGTTMIVCADQPVPSGWVRQGEEGGTSACEGARVAKGEPTTRTIRRVSAQR